MRLIDADVFKENMDYVCDAGGWLEPVTKAVTEYVKKHIDAQTTVDAIPLEWIAEWMGKHQGLGFDGWNFVVGTLVRDWAERKEA